MPTTAERELDELRWRVQLLEKQLAIALGSRPDAVPDPDALTGEPGERATLLAEVERSTSLGTWVWDLPTNRVTWSPGLYEILGYDPSCDEPSTDAFFDLVHPSDTERVRAVAVDAVESGEIVPTEFRVVRPDGDVRELASCGAAVQDAHGNAVRLVGTIVDMTAQRRTERALRRSESRLKQAQRIAHVGSWAWDATTGRIEWSEEMYRICGVSPSVEPSVESYFELVHPDDRERVMAVSSDALENGVAQPHEYRIVRPDDGTERHVHTAGKTLRDADGRVIGFVGTLLDVTERHKLEEQLLHSQKLEAVGRLAGGVAHDFNNVLSAILGNAELIEAKLPEDSPLLERLERIRTAGERAAGLTRQLLTFARREIVAPEAVDTAPLLAELEQLLEPLLGEHVTLETRTPDGLWPVHIDRGQLQQVLVNLAVNARDAMPDGGTLVIETANAPLAAGDVAGLPAGEYVRIDVTDDGEGMDAEARRHAFEPFFTTKAAGVGTGLGLATCHGIVAQNGGHIGFRSRPGAGTTFALHLVRATEEPSIPDPDTLTPVPHGRETVLVLEDEPLVREMLVEALEGAGYATLAAGDGPEAIRLADEHPTGIHLLLSDVVLPGMSGPQVADKLREDRPRLRVMFVTGYPDQQLVRRGTMRRGTTVLQKPFTPDAVTRAVAELLAR